MAKNNNINDFMKDVANAIRTKTNKTNKINPQNFSSEILNIQSGIKPEGVISIEENGTYDVTEYGTAEVNVKGGEYNIIQEETEDGVKLHIFDADNKALYCCKVMDYDGSIIKEEYHASGEMFELPNEFPVHDKLIAQEWVGPVEIVNNKVTVTDKDLTFGVVYTTKSGLSEFDIIIPKSLVGANIGFNMDGTKDWGDGTVNTSNVHQYTTPGKYTITCDGTYLGNQINSYRDLFAASMDDWHNFIIDARIGPNVTKIGSGFGSSSGLRTITIPNTVMEITGSDLGYMVCSNNLAEVVTIPATITNLSNSGISAKEVILPHTITTMDSLEVYGMNALSLPDTLNTISKLIAPLIPRIKLPSNLTTLGNVTCDSITELTLPNTLVSVGTIECAKIRKLILPNTISSKLSLNCEHLSEVTLSNKITNIDSIMLGNSRNDYLTKLNVPSSVTTINAKAFQNCAVLQRVNFTEHSQIPTLTSSTLQGLNFSKERFQIVVPDELYDAWVLATNWSNNAKYIYKASEV